jgi:hypothetical protein
MRKKKFQKAEKFLEIQSQGITFAAINRNGWWIKLSMYKHYVLMVFVSAYTGQTVIRYYADENDAVEFINHIMNLDPTQSLELEKDDEGGST